MIIKANERFQEESETINAYVDYIENNFYQRSCSVIRTEGYEAFQVLNNYKFFTENKEEKEANKRIIDQLSVIVKQKIELLQSKLAQMLPADLPIVSEKLKSFELFDGLCGYIENSVYDCIDNPMNLEHFELIDSFTPLELKKEIDIQDVLAEEKYYDMLDEEDYKSILSYMKIKLYNDDIDYTKQQLEEYYELKTLYNIFDDKNPINLYRQAFILLMTAFDATIFDIFTDIFSQGQYRTMA